MPLALRRVEFGSSVKHPLIIKYMQITGDHGIDHLQLIVVDDVPERFDRLVGHLHDIVRQVLRWESPVSKPDAFNIPSISEMILRCDCMSSCGRALL